MDGVVNGELRIENGELSGHEIQFSTLNLRMEAGLAATVRWAWKVTDTRATRRMTIPATANIHQ
jgi:hypothetical protein